MPFLSLIIIPRGPNSFYAFAEAGDSRLEIGGSSFFGGNAVVSATSVSSLVIFEDVPFGPYPCPPANALTAMALRILGVTSDSSAGA